MRTMSIYGAQTSDAPKFDEAAHAYLPYLFGPRGWALVQRPAELPARLAAVYARLTR